MKIICVGSSIVNGFPLKRSQCWVSLWRAASGYEIINKGVNGSTSSDMLSRFPSDVLAHKPDMVLIMTGTNDFMLRIADPSGVLANIAAMCDMAVKHDIKPVIVSSIPVDILLATEKWAVGAGFDYSAVQNDLASLHALLINYATSNAFGMIDFYSVYSNALINGRASDYFIDGIHPTILGHQLLADSIRL